MVATASAITARSSSQSVPGNCGYREGVFRGSRRGGRLLLCALSVLALVSAAPSSTAELKKILGSNRGDTLRGTARADSIYGRAGNDKLFGRGGNDRLFPGPGRDRVDCGPGRDRVFADRADRVARNCEKVTRPKVPAPPAPDPPAPPASTPPEPPLEPAPTGPVVVPTASSPCMLAPNQQSEQLEAGFGFPLFHEGPLNTAGALPTAGTTNAVAIAVDFPDVPATPTQDAAALLSTTVSGLGRFQEYSFGRYAVSAQVVPGWRRMSKPAASYASLSDGGPGMRDFLTEATGLVDLEVDFSNVQFVFVIAPGLAPNQAAGNPAWSAFPGRGFARDGTELRHGTVMMRAFTTAHQDIASVAIHELAHSLGLPENYKQIPGGTRFDLVGMWDAMSEPTQHHFHAWHKYRVGWIDQSQVTCLDAPGQVSATLTPVEAGGGTKLVVVRTAPSNAYVIEARRKVGLDGNLCKEGVLVYTVDSQVSNGGGPVVVQRAAEDVPGEEQNRCGTLYNAPYVSGQTFEDANVKVTVTAATPLRYTVEVTRK